MKWPMTHVQRTRARLLGVLGLIGMLGFGLASCGGGGGGAGGGGGLQIPAPTPPLPAPPPAFLSQAGYTSRPCGFDMNRNGVLGEAADCLVADGSTADPDGDGVDEDLIYVDATSGSDVTGDGSAANPYQTIQHALDAADGPGDGAEDIICISGVFSEELNLTVAGVPGSYTRDGFDFPTNPTMIVGWDKDGDGEYPPYDTDDVAVLDGLTVLSHAVTNPSNRSYVEVAHLTIRDYQDVDSGGAFRMAVSGGQPVNYFYVHDVEMIRINKGMADASGVIVFSFWGRVGTDIAIVNNLVNEYGSYFARGSPGSAWPSGRFRFQNNTIVMHGSSAPNGTIGWKLWGPFNGCEILYNLVDCNPDAWNPSNVVGIIGANLCSQDWLIRGNVFRDPKHFITIKPFESAAFCASRPVTNVVIDGNLFEVTSTYYRDNFGHQQPTGIQIQSGPTMAATVADVTISNNMFAAAPGLSFRYGVECYAGNDEGPQPGTVTIVGNTFTAARTNTGFSSGTIVIDDDGRAFPQQNFVFRNNIIASTLGGNGDDNIGVSYAPTNFLANGNVFDPTGSFRWNNVILPDLTAWQAATGRDDLSIADVPMFLDEANLDVHLHPTDTVAIGTGVDITSVVGWDFDADARSASTPVAGADVP